MIEFLLSLLLGYKIAEELCPSTLSKQQSNEKYTDEPVKKKISWHGIEFDEEIGD